MIGLYQRAPLTDSRGDSLGAGFLTPLARDSSPEVIRLVVMMYVRYPLSLRNVEDLLAERGIDISHETVQFWWNRFGPMFAAEILKRRVAHMRGYPQWRWHWMRRSKVNGKPCYLWRAVHHEDEVLEAVVTAKRDKAVALKLLKRIMKKYGAPRSVVTDGLRAYSAAMLVLEPIFEADLPSVLYAYRSSGSSTGHEDGGHARSPATS